ncbi:hypothetical protein [Halorussus halophilus]|uniref:hypothetical protein n=1 Tax=Halorussus halophilus TaxID=2650975 RepID=UPI0013011FE5|nr:hypothetical protein [Halorussus halophilus]
MRKLLPAFVLVFLLGVLVGGVGGAGSGFVSSAPDDTSRDFDSPPLSLGKATGSCGETKADAGWVHDVAVGKSFAVTLNATVQHAPTETVKASVTKVSPGYFRIDLRTVQSDRSEAAQQKMNDTASVGCTETELRLATSLPTDYESFEITMNGRTLRTVEYDGTVADLHQLPNPIEGRESAANASDSAN